MEDYEQQARTLMDRFIQKGYNRELIEQEMNTVKEMERQTLVQDKECSATTNGN